MCQSRVVIFLASLCVYLHAYSCAYSLRASILSWLRLWDEAVFGRPTPLKSTGSSGGGGGAGAGGRGKGGSTGEGAKGVGPPPKGRLRRGWSIRTQRLLLELRSVSFVPYQALQLRGRGQQSYNYTHLKRVYVSSKSLTLIGLFLT